MLRKLVLACPTTVATMSGNQPVMLAEKWEETIDPTGYWMSEKLDGVRAYWDGANFYSRNGIRYHAPKFFREALPKVPLDGELWCGRGQFQKCVSFVKKKDKNVKDDEWKFVTYLIFDAPAHPAVYEERVKYINTVIKPEDPNCYAAVVGIKKCTGRAHLDATLKEVLALGGEGVMLRAPRSKYEKTRSKLLLKVKTFHDDEAVVIGYRAGEGRLLGSMGAIECKLTNGLVFHIGSGFSDAQRKKPPKVGEVVTFKYQELSNNGHPRFPVFLRVRGDVTWDEVMKNAKTSAPASTVQKVIPTLKKQHTLLFSTVPSRDEKGNKFVADGDVAEDVADEEIKPKPDPAPAAVTTPSLPACKYGASCYQTNAKHLAQFSHPPKAAPVPPKKAEAPPDFDATVLLPLLEPDSDDEEKSKEDTIPMDEVNLETDTGGSQGSQKVSSQKIVAAPQKVGGQKKMDLEIDNDPDLILSDDDSGDDKEQALISQKDWKALCRRMAALEQLVNRLSSAEKKRPRDTVDDADEPMSKKRKP